MTLTRPLFGAICCGLALGLGAAAGWGGDNAIIVGTSRASDALVGRDCLYPCKRTGACGDTVCTIREGNQEICYCSGTGTWVRCDKASKNKSTCGFNKATQVCKDQTQTCAPADSNCNPIGPSVTTGKCWRYDANTGNNCP